MSLKISKGIARRRVAKGRRITQGMLGMFAAAAIITPTANAQSYWLPTSGADYWNVAANWSAGTVPTTTTDAVNNNAAATIYYNTTTDAVHSFQSDGAFSVLGGTFSGAQANAASTVQVNSTFMVDGGGLANLTVLAGSGGQGVTFSGNGNNFVNGIISAADFAFNQDSYTRVYNANTVNGFINMASTTNGLQFQDGNAALTLGTTGGIKGYGILTNYFGGGILTNNGLISGNVSGKTLFLNQSNTVNNNIIEAKNGGTVAIGGRLNGGTSSQVNTDAASLVIVDNGGITGTLGSSTGSGLSYSGNGNNYIDTAVVNGILTFGQDAYARVYNASTVNGTINMASTTGGLQFQDGNASLTLDAVGGIKGYGLLINYFGGGTVINNGTVSGDISGKTLYLNQSYTTNNGTIEGKNGGMVSIGGRLTGGGAGSKIVADTGTVLIDNGGLSGTTGSTTGTGLSFSGSGNNYIDTATFGGTLTFNQDGYARVYNSNTVNGFINMASTTNGLQFQDGNASLTLGASGGIKGYGSLINYFGGGTVTNNGLISGDVSGQRLSLNNTYLNSNGTIEGVNGGTVAIGGLLTGGTASQINAASGTVVIDGGGVTGTIGSTTGSGLSFSGSGNNYLSAITNNGTFTFGQDGYARLYNTNTLNGELRFASTTNGIQFQDGNAILNIGTGGSLHGYGSLYLYFGGGAVANSGTASADVSGQTLSVGITSFTNNGLAEAKNGGTLALNTGTTPINAGTVNVHADGTITTNGDLLQTAGSTVVNGSLNLNGGNNTLTLNGTTSGGTLLGTGTITGSINNVNGNVNPGNSPGTLTLAGTYAQGSAGSLTAEIAGSPMSGNYDKLIVGSAVTFDGTLNVALLNGFLPQFGDTYDILDFTSRTGTFANATLTGGNYGIEVLYDVPTNVRVRFTQVPAPSSLFVMGAGMLAAMIRLRRRPKA